MAWIQAIHFPSLLLDANSCCLHRIEFSHLLFLLFGREFVKLFVCAFRMRIRHRWRNMLRHISTPSFPVWWEQQTCDTYGPPFTPRPPNTWLVWKKEVELMKNCVYRRDESIPCRNRGECFDKSVAIKFLRGKQKCTKTIMEWNERTCSCRSGCSFSCFVVSNSCVACITILFCLFVFFLDRCQHQEKIRQGGR